MTPTPCVALTPGMIWAATGALAVLVLAVIILALALREARYAATLTGPALRRWKDR